MQKEALSICIALAMLASFALLWQLGEAPLAEYDEGTYAEVLDNSFISGNFLTFSRYERPWFEKPPLYFWLAAPAVAWCAEGSQTCKNFAVRLPSALAGIGVVILAMVLAYTLAKNYWAGAGAGALLLMTPPFMAGSRTMLMDILISFFILLAMYAFIKKKYWIFGAAVALAVLSKSAIAVFALAAVPIVSWWFAPPVGGFSWLSDKKFWYGVALAVVIAAPWHLYETMQHGGAFWQDYLGRHVIERFESNLFGDPALQTNYPLHLGVSAPVLSVLFLVACVLFVALWRKLSATEWAGSGVPLSMALFMLTVFFSAQTHAFSYLLPVYPFAAVAVALVVQQCVYIFNKR